MPKKKQTHLTTEQLIANSERQREFMKKMQFVKGEFYPALCAATESIEGALQTLSIINTVLMEKFLAKMKETTFKEIDVYTNLSSEDPKYEELKKMLNLFDDKNVFEAKELMEGMRSEINMFLNDEQKERKLETLKTSWLGDDRV